MIKISLKDPNTLILLFEPSNIKYLVESGEPIAVNLSDFHPKYKDNDKDAMLVVGYTPDIEHVKDCMDKLASDGKLNVDAFIDLVQSSKDMAPVYRGTKH